MTGSATLASLAAGTGRFVHRQEGSGTRLLLNHLLATAGLDAARLHGQVAPVEHAHLAVAATIAAGKADAGLGIEAAAQAYGLRFLPLACEDYFLVCLKADLNLQAVQAVQQQLASAAWQQALADLPGYGPQRPGQVVSLTRALPWWQFRTRRTASKFA